MLTKRNMKNNYNTTIKIGRIKLNALVDWAYNQGKNDSKEGEYKRLRDNRVEKLQ